MKNNTRARPAGTDQILLAAAFAGVHGIPRVLPGPPVRSWWPSCAVPGRVARPVVARVIRAVRERAAVELRAGQNVVLVRACRPRLDRFPFSLSAVACASVFPMRASSIVSPCSCSRSRATDAALDVVPRSLADAVARVDRVRSLRAQVGAPLTPASRPTAVASAWQCASAPASPPRFAPLPRPTLVTKNVMGCAGWLPRP